MATATATATTTTSSFVDALPGNLNNDISNNDSQQLSLERVRQSVRRMSLESIEDCDDDGDEVSDLASQVEHRLSAADTCDERLIMAARSCLRLGDAFIRHGLSSSLLPKASFSPYINAIAAYHHAIQLCESYEIEQNLLQQQSRQHLRGPSGETLVSKAHLAIGKVYQIQGHHEKAIEELSTCLEMQREFSSRCQTSPIDEACTLSLLASSKASLGHLYDAIEDYSEALHIQEAVLGPMHQHTARSLESIGQLFYRLGDVELSKHAFKRLKIILKHNDDKIKAQQERRKMSRRSKRNGRQQQEKRRSTIERVDDGEISQVMFTSLSDFEFLASAA